MATRKFLQYFREARSGNGLAQLALGKNFLRGGKGVAPSMAGALIWLSKAAKQGIDEARQLIGEHIPVKVAFQYPDPEFMLSCYRLVGTHGSVVARWQYVQWILDYPSTSHSQEDIDLALAWLQDLADEGSTLACWKLAQICYQGKFIPTNMEKATYYAELAANGGEHLAARWLAHQALAREDKDGVLKHVAVLVPELLAKVRVSQEDAQLLYEYASHGIKILHTLLPYARKLVLQALHHAARSELAQAQFLYGLWVGQLDCQGERFIYSYADYRTGSLKKAAQWLALAAEQNYADAWYVLAVLYRKTQFSQYDAKQSDYCLLQAAQLGHGFAQLRLAKYLWRSRKSQPNADVQACTWFWHSAQQGFEEAQAWVKKIAQSCPKPEKNKWFNLAKFIPEHHKNGDMALLMQRIQIANQFDLDKAELLLLDIVAVQPEYCLVVDIRSWLSRSARRLILIETPLQHLVLSKAIKVFSENKLAVNGEGNYRQRCYRLEKLLSLAGLDMSDEDPRITQF